MSSDRLSFNQNAQDPDDDARWEAYLALQRRTQPPPDPDDEIEPDAEQPPRYGDPEPVSEVDSPREYAAAPFAEGEDDQSETSDAAVASESDDEARIGPLFVQPAAPLARRKTRPAHRNTRLVGATAALTAGIILAAALVPRPPAQPAADVRPPLAALPAAPAVAAPAAVAPAVAATPVLRPREEQAAASSAAVSAAPPARSPHRLQTARLEKAGPRECRDCRADHAAPPVHREPQCWIADANAESGVRLADCPRPASMMEGPD